MLSKSMYTVLYWYVLLNYDVLITKNHQNSQSVILIFNGTGYRALHMYANLTVNIMDELITCIHPWSIYWNNSCESINHLLKQTEAFEKTKGTWTKFVQDTLH